MKPTRHATIRGHLVEEYRSLNCPICYIDAHRVTGSFEHAVADLLATGQVPPKSLSEGAGSAAPAVGHR